MSAVQLKPGMWVVHTEFPDDIFQLVDYDFEYSFWMVRYTDDSGVVHDVESPCELLTPFWAQPGDEFKTKKGFVTIGTDFIKTKQDGCKIKLADIMGQWGMVSTEELLKINFI